MNPNDPRPDPDRPNDDADGPDPSDLDSTDPFFDPIFPSWWWNLLRIVLGLCLAGVLVLGVSRLIAFLV